MEFVMVVDDDEELRELLAQYLRRSGRVVSTAGDGREALATLASAATPPLAVVLDLDMPVMDGRAFLAEKARRPALADVPVLIVSGATNIDELARHRDVVGIHRKPLRPDEIRAQLDALAVASSPPALALDGVAAVTVVTAPSAPADPGDPTSGAGDA